MYALVVDDSRTMRRIVTATLTAAGFTCAEAGDGQEALDVLGSLAGAGHPPAVATVDWNMPVMDGLSFVQQVRDDPRWAEVRLIMITTESEYSRIEDALRAGADEYLMKPFSPDDLLSKLALLDVLDLPAVTGA